MSTVLKLAPQSQVLPCNNKHLQSWLNYLKLSTEIKQNWAGLGSFEICFCEILKSASVKFLTAIAKTLFLEGRLGTNICLHSSSLRFFQYFLFS